MTKRIRLKEYGDGIVAETYLQENFVFGPIPTVDLVTYEPRKIFKGNKRVMIDSVTAISARYNTQEELREILVSYADDLHLTHLERVRKYAARDALYGEADK
jgi:hypothetical protein